MKLLCVAFVLIGMFGPVAVADGAAELSVRSQLTAMQHQIAALQIQIDHLANILSTRQSTITQRRQQNTTATNTIVSTKYFSIGSTMALVEAVQGIPTSVSALSSRSTNWWYGNSLVQFTDGRVEGWRDSDGILKRGRATPYGATQRSQSTTVNTARNSSISSGGVAENGSYYGEISEATGRPKTVGVRGYYRSDGTYVRGHYRSKPRR